MSRWLSEIFMRLFFSRMGTDDSTFIRIFATRSWKSLQKTDELYKEVRVPFVGNALMPSRGNLNALHLFFFSHSDTDYLRQWRRRREATFGGAFNSFVS